MSLSKSLLAAGILVASGFTGGFLVSKGSGQVLGLKPTHAVRGHGGGASDLEETAAAAIFNASAGDDALEEPRQHPTLNQSGSDAGGVAPSGAVAPGGAGAAGGAGSAGQGAAGGGGSLGTGPARLLTGSEAATSLSGNTVQATLPNGASHFIYYAPRGLKAEGSRGDFAVTHWRPTATSICDPGEDGVRVCRPLRLRANGGAAAAGAPIGQLELADGRWAPVYAGDLIGLPAHIPSIDSALAPDLRSPPQDKQKSKASPDVAATLIGQVFEVADDAQERSAVVLSLLRDGTRLVVEHPGGDVDSPGDATVRLGRWTIANGILCQSEGGAPSTQACAKPRSTGGADVLLVSTQKAPAMRLTPMTERPMSQAEAAE